MEGFMETLTQIYGSYSLGLARGCDEWSTIDDATLGDER